MTYVILVAACILCAVLWVRLIEPRIEGGVFTKGKESSEALTGQIGEYGYTVTLSAESSPSTSFKYCIMYVMKDESGKQIDRSWGFSDKDYEDAEKDALEKARNAAKSHSQAKFYQTKTINI